MGDCVIALAARVVDQITTRRLRVVKYRGSRSGRNEYPYVITETGFRIAPISTVGLRHKPLGERITTGNERLDDILGGGYRRGACVLLAGEPGTGKTLLASTFAASACNREERVLYISFEESEAALVGNVSTAGVDLRPYCESGRLSFLASFPEATGAEEHYINAISRIEALSPAHVVVDAISACERMGGKLAAFEYLMRLLNSCKERGITILLTNQTTGTRDFMELSGNGISSMVDTVIRLAYREDYGETTRLLRVTKSRGSAHANQKREYVISGDGIQILDVYLGDGDVLTGTARQVQEEKDRAEAQRLDYEIQTKKLELKRLQQIQKQVADGIAKRAAMRGADLHSKRLQHAPEDRPGAAGRRDKP